MFLSLAGQKHALDMRPHPFDIKKVRIVIHKHYLCKLTEFQIRVILDQQKIVQIYTTRFSGMISVNQPS